MIQLLQIKYFYIICYVFLIILLFSLQKIKADQEIKIVADKISIEEIDNFKLINASGNAIATFENGEKIKADSLIYDEENSVISASGNIIVEDLEENIFFMERINAVSDMNKMDGSIVRVRMNDESRIVGSNIIRNNEITALNNAEFTPCKEDRYLIKNCPGWKLKAKKIYHDRDKKTIYYDHAMLNLFNLPFFYLPYFSHPDPSVKKRSGFLMPTIQTDSQLGDTLSVPVFYNIKNNLDLTFTPTIQSQSNNFYSFNYRQLEKFGKINIDASIDDNNDSQGTKSHIFIDAILNNPYGNLETFYQSSNNDTYMRKNKINKLTVLNSGVNFDRSTETSFFSFSAIGYKHLTIQDAEQWEYVYPKINFNLDELQTNLFNIDGEFSLNNQFSYQKNLDENYTLLASSQMNWRNNNVHRETGILFNNESNFRIISISNDYKDARDTDNVRLYPQVHSKISLPLIKSSKHLTQTISPVIMPVIAPYNNYTNAQEITNSNIFSPNRATDITQWESGPRINYGIEWFIDNLNSSNLKLTLGQNYRINKDRNDSTEELSDYYLSSNVSLNRNNYFNNTFIIDQDDIDVKTISMNTYSKLYDLIFAIDYDYTSGKYADPNEQISIGSKYEFKDDFFFRFTGSKNIDTNKNIGYQYGLLYENDCLGIDLNYYRDLTKDRDIEESDGYSFTIVLKPFGSTRSYGKNKVFGPQI